eukprot:3405800-Karenia_brevis.AAC.1
MAKETEGKRRRLQFVAGGHEEHTKELAQLPQSGSGQKIDGASTNFIDALLEIQDSRDDEEINEVSVAEVYSPPRVVAEAIRRGIKGH